MVKRLTIFLATTVVTILSLVAIDSPAQAAPKATNNAVNAKFCGASDPAAVQADKKTDTVTVTGNDAAGNNFYCYTDIPVSTGDTVTFSFMGTCGGGAPRVYLQFNGGAFGENTHDFGTCTQLTPTTGTVSYTIVQGGTITAFAMIHDRDSGSTTYSNFVIAGTRINF